jgi:hypothetical protein
MKNTKPERILATPQSAKKWRKITEAGLQQDLLELRRLKQQLAAMPRSTLDTLI